MTLRMEHYTLYGSEMLPGITALEYIEVFQDQLRHLLQIAQPYIEAIVLGFFGNVNCSIEIKCIRGGDHNCSSLALSEDA